jgi:hypothetical protein
MYNTAKQYIIDGTVDLDTTVLKMKIAKGTAAANVSAYGRSTFASITGAPSNMSQKTLTAVSVTIGSTASTARFDCADVVFTASGGASTSCQYAVIGVSGGKAICWSKLSTASFDVSSGNTLTITINASGVFELTGMTT